MADRFPLILNTSTNQIQEIPSGDNLDLTGVGINNVGVITSGNVQIGAATTDLVVTGDARITGILTVGTSSLKLDGPNNLVNVGTALTLGHTQGLQFHTQNLHSAGFEVNQINASGIITATGADINGDIDVDGHTNLDNVSIAGITTMNGDLLLDSNSAEINLKAGTGGQTGRINWTFHTTDTNYSSIYLPFDSRVTDGLTVDGNDYNVSVKSAGSVRLYASNAIKLYTLPSGIVVNGNGTFTGNVSIGGTLTYEDVTNIDSVGIVTAREGIFIPDNKELKIGNTAASSDLRIYSNGAESFADSYGGNFYIRVSDQSGGVENKLVARPNAQTELYYNDAKKIETTSTGIKVSSPSANPDIKITGAVGSGAEHRIFVAGSNSEALQITGNTRLFYNANDHHFRDASTTQNLFVIDSNGDVNLPRDNKKIQIGAGGDLSLYHNGSNSFILNGTGYLRVAATAGGLYLDGTGVYIRSEAGDENYAVFNNDGASELYHNNVKRLETFDNNPFVGVSVTRDLVLNSDGDSAIRWAVDGNASSNFKWGMYYAHSDGHLRIFDNVNSRTVAVWKNSGAIELNYAASKKFETTTYGVSIGGSAGSISATTGIEISNAATTEVRLKNTAGGTGATDGFAIQKWNNGNTYLYEYDNSNILIGTNNATRWQFTGGGGHFEPWSNNTYDIGSSSKRVRNLYTNDLNLSNEGSSNDVDNTWGDYTIQEGESDLFLINNRSGKKYKFNLTEVS